MIWYKGKNIPTETRDRQLLLLHSPGQELSDVSGRQEVHHHLIALFHGEQLIDLHVSASARSPAHLFPESSLLVFVAGSPKVQCMVVTVSLDFTPWLSILDFTRCSPSCSSYLRRTFVRLSCTYNQLTHSHQQSFHRLQWRKRCSSVWAVLPPAHSGFHRCQSKSRRCQDSDGSQLWKYGKLSGFPPAFAAYFFSRRYTFMLSFMAWGLLSILAMGGEGRCRRVQKTSCITAKDHFKKPAASLR